VIGMAAHAFTTTAFVKDGKLSVRNRDRFDEFVACQKDGEYEVSIERLRATRSLQQNRYFFACVVHPFAEHSGYTANEAYELLKAHHFPKDVAVRTSNGVVVGDYVIGATTTKLSKDDFGEFITVCREWLLEKFDIRTEDADPGYVGKAGRSAAA
jgi:hypothetical protein